MFRLVAVIVAVLTLQGISLSAAEENLTLVVGFAAGGNSSRAARIFADSIESTTGKSVIVENRPGAGGALAAEYVKNERGRNIVFFMASTSSVKVPPNSGLVPIGIVAEFKFVAVARKEMPPTLSSYLEAARHNDRLRNVGTPGAGSIPHLIGVKSFRDHGLTVVNVPFQGASPAIQAVIGGHVSLAIVPFTDFLPFTDTLQVVGETGGSIASDDGWQAIYAPEGTSPEAVARLAHIFSGASAHGKGRLEAAGFRQVWKDASELRRVHTKDYDRWLPLLTELGIYH